ncbi:MAG: helix-turn-helix domain-containing protein, partial [Nanoarchaeota archaeon]
KKFNFIIKHIEKSKGYKFIKEIERSEDTLLLLVVLYQTSYIQNLIQKSNAFFIDLHTVYSCFEYWHVGIINRDIIPTMIEELRKMGKMRVLYLGEVDFAHRLLSKQQKKVFNLAFESGYYNIPRNTTISKIAKSLKLNSSTVGEHLIRAENKLINMVAKKL